MPRSTRPLATRSAEELRALQDAAELVCETLRLAREAVVEGALTSDIDGVVSGHFTSRGAETLFLGYTSAGATPFPAHTCISVNEEVVHGIPGPRSLRKGDLVSVDIGIRLGGWCGDSADSFIVGGEQANHGAAKLREATRGVLDLAVELMAPGTRWSHIARELEVATDRAGFGLVTEFVGHGIGQELHEPPKVPAFWSGYAGDDFTLAEGMVLSIEPMLTAGRGPIPGRASVPAGLPPYRMPVEVDPKDRWTVRTADGGAACHVERMVAVTDRGARLLADM